METIRALIQRLQEQADENALPGEMLATANTLQNVLQEAVAATVRKVKSGNISVVYPAGNRLVEPKEPAVSVRLEPKVEPKPEPAREPEEVMHAAYRPAQSFVEPKQEGQPAYSRYDSPAANRLRPPAPDFTYEPEPRREPEKTPPVEQKFPLPDHAEERISKPSPAPVEPRVSSEQSRQREMNDIFSQYRSLNDHHTSEDRDLGSMLNDEPVKDLRKAIGINDRFVFLNELFRGDDVMYERSLKTINNFRIFPEAEYWIERELKVKLGWDENKAAVKHFRQLVRRRFLG